MKLFKLFTSSLVVAVIGLFIYQNIPTFEIVHEFSLDLFIREQLKWSHHLYTLLFFAGFLGFALGLGVMLKPYLNARRLLAQEKQEKQQVQDAQQTIPETKEAGEAS